MRIGCLQFAPLTGDVDFNLSRADSVLSKADQTALGTLNNFPLPPPPRDKLSRPKGFGLSLSQSNRVCKFNTPLKHPARRYLYVPEKRDRHESNLKMTYHGVRRGFLRLYYIQFSIDKPSRECGFEFELVTSRNMITVLKTTPDRPRRAIHHPKAPASSLPIEFTHQRVSSAPPGPHYRHSPSYASVVLLPGADIIDALVANC
ncbi:hypothetical protein MAPG_10506 [Magnaporthiopsis poae ATCC 64411]|uniref:Uncharacterized protein n=1 Tax=Magnaporthiopsis poae (strain ATCC 64411 / 73-15) TaxID=644358 RepID=A0A0C4ECS1_MAGP6|nr:hypothetical protein MAPG_10506 [Magnaporthiopsis poae ATCC 64411]